MRGDIKREWTTRLRSGIKQTTGVLATGDARCAMGVLCDIAVEHGITSKEVMSEMVIYAGSHAYTPPDAVLTWAGIWPVDVHHIETLNDKGCTFEEIAKYIETHL
jgi:hypothetical protein